MDARGLILKHNRRRYKHVDIPAVGAFRLQSLTEAERSAMETMPREDIKAFLVTVCVVDEEGKRVFTDADISAVKLVDSCVINALVDAIYDHVGLAAADMAQLLGECTADQGGDSCTG